MSLKKKLGLGAASAALGLSLIGGGTFAYFNDTATVNNQFAAGTLNLDVLGDNEGAINFDLRNLKPGDTAKRYFVLENGGTLSIKDVLMEVTAFDFVDGFAPGNDSIMEEYLDQFEVDFFRVQDPENYANPETWGNRVDLTAGTVTLADLVAKDYSGIAGGYVDGTRIDIAPSGLPVNDKDGIGIQITFVNNGNQNKYQGDSVKVAFNLEATQEAGVEVKENGYIESNENHPSTPVKVDPSDNIDEITDAVDNPEEN